MNKRGQNTDIANIRNNCDLTPFYCGTFPSTQLLGVLKMGIDVKLRTEGGEVLGEVGDEKAILSRATTNGSLSGKRLLRYLVPWGDAIFNQAQSDDLLLDVREVIKEQNNKELSELMKNVEPLIDLLHNETHTYLWFIGN